MMAKVIFNNKKIAGDIMKKMMLLGLKALPQSILVWQRGSENYVSYEDSLKVMDNYQVTKSLAIRVAQYRLNKALRGV